jgi:hypothetical protein
MSAADVVIHRSKNLMSENQARYDICDSHRSLAHQVASYTTGLLTEDQVAKIIAITSKVDTEFSIDLRLSLIRFIENPKKRRRDAIRAASATAASTFNSQHSSPRSEYNESSLIEDNDGENDDIINVKKVFSPSSLRSHVGKPIASECAEKAKALIKRLSMEKTPRMITVATNMLKRYEENPKLYKGYATDAYSLLLKIQKNAFDADEVVVIKKKYLDCDTYNTALE